MLGFTQDSNKLLEGLTKVSFDSNLSNSFQAVANALWYRYPLNFYIYEIKSKVIDMSIIDERSISLTKLKTTRKGFNYLYSIEKFTYDFSNRMINYYEEILNDGSSNVKVFEIANFKEVVTENKTKMVRYCKDLFTSDANASTKVMTKGFEFFKKKVEYFDKSKATFQKINDFHFNIKVGIN